MVHCETGTQCLAVYKCVQAAVTLNVYFVYYRYRKWLLITVSILHYEYRQKLVQGYTVILVDKLPLQTVRNCINKLIQILGRKKKRKDRRKEIS